MLERAAIGFVTAEDVVRTWTRDGSTEWLVDRPAELRDLLGAGRTDRSPLVPNARVETGVLDVGSATLTVVAPFDEADAKIYRLAEPFDLVRVQAVLPWSAASRDVFLGWCTDRLRRASSAGEVLCFHERDADEEGSRVVSAGIYRVGGWQGALATNAPPSDDESWGQHADGTGALVALPHRVSVFEDLAAMILDVVRSWPGGPLDVIAGWGKTGDGPAPRPDEAAHRPEVSQPCSPAPKSVASRAAKAGLAGRPSFVAAHRIMTAGVLTFEDAFVLTRLVLELGAGPATFKGKKGQLPKDLVKALVRAGYVERVGTSEFVPEPLPMRFSIDPRLFELMDDRYAATELHALPVEEKASWVAVATQEGLDLVAAHLR